LEIDRSGREFEDIEEVVQHTAIGVQDHALQGAHAKVFQGAGVLVAHGLQMLGQHLRHRFHFGLRAKGAYTLDFFGQHHVFKRNMRDHEGVQLTLVVLVLRRGAAHRQAW